MIDLAALTSLRAVDTHGSVVAAADALGFTPSAISQQVKRLEKQAGVPLLERVGRGVMLTDHGRHLVDDGSRLLSRPRGARVGAAPRRRTGSPGGSGSPPSRPRCAAWSRRSSATCCDEHPDLALTLTEREPWDTDRPRRDRPAGPRHRAQLGRRAAARPRPPRRRDRSPATSPT